MFIHEFNRYSWETVRERIYNATISDVERALNSEFKNIDDFFPLFSPSADNYLENMAQLSLETTRMRFGNTIQLYTPLYISNECNNSCLYCGFNVKNKIKRTTLTIDQVLEEAEIIYQMGFRHILLLTGEDKKSVPVQYLREIAEKLHGKFASISLEVYPMDIDEYSNLEKSGIDGLTIYQETYDQDLYSQLHPFGKKRDFEWRINTPDRGAASGLRRVGVGSLLGLSDWRVDGFFTALHAHYLMKKFWRCHVQVSFPRIREAAGAFKALHYVSDRNLAQLICTMRILMPDVGLVLSTRESRTFRDNILPLGITVMSAGSKTSPGGYSHIDLADDQFSVDDDRSPEEIALMIKEKGFEPVWKDWDKSFLEK